MSRKKKSNGNILSDHIKVGKVFKPPITQIGQFEETNWVKITMPELFWLGLILEKCGLYSGIDLSLSLALEAKQFQPDDQNLWFATISSYAALTDEGKNTVRNRLSSLGKLQPIQEALRSLIYFYPECPLAFLFEESPADLSVNSNGLTKLKEVLASLYPKRDRLPILVQVQGVYIALVSQILVIPKGVVLENLEAVKDYPDTEESLQVGASACATCNMLIGVTLKENNASWSNYFWKRGFELDDCEYQLPYSL